MEHEISPGIYLIKYYCFLLFYYCSFIHFRPNMIKNGSASYDNEIHKVDSSTGNESENTIFIGEMS